MKDDRKFSPLESFLIISGATIIAWGIIILEFNIIL